VIERDSLKEANEELKCCQTQMKKTNTIDHSQITTGEDMESAMDLKFVKLTICLYNYIAIYNYEFIDKN
jgi:hypothetical protein